MIPASRSVLVTGGTGVLGRAVVARFAPAEFAAVELLASLEPEAASHGDLGRVIWGGIGFDQYQIHRLMQRIRQRLGSEAGLLENVRGAGYRLTAPIEIR